MATLAMRCKPDLCWTLNVVNNFHLEIFKWVYLMLKIAFKVFRFILFLCLYLTKFTWIKTRSTLALDRGKDKTCSAMVDSSLNLVFPPESRYELTSSQNCKVSSVFSQFILWMSWYWFSTSPIFSTPKCSKKGTMVCFYFSKYYRQLMTQFAWATHNYREVWKKIIIINLKIKLNLKNVTFASTALSALPQISHSILIDFSSLVPIFGFFL